MAAYDIGLTYSATRAQPRTMSQADLGELCTTAGWVHDNAEAVCVIMHESNGKTDARSKNPDGNENIGIFQIDTVNVIHGEYLKDPVYCANVARRMWRADGGSFSKRWSTASQCVNSKGNVPLSDEADAVGVGGIVEDTSRWLQGVTDLLNNIPWFRLGKGAFGFVLLVMGAGVMVFVVANKAAGSSAGKAAIKVTPAGKIKTAVKTLT